MFSAFFLFKGRGYNNPKFYASVLSTFIITLLSLNLFFLGKIGFDLPNSFVLAIFPIAISFEKLCDKYFDRVYEKTLKYYQHLESRKLQNTVTIIVYYFLALISVILTAGLMKHLE